MKPTPSLFTAALVLTLAGTGIASAHDKDGAGPRGAGPDFDRLLERFDSDGDGTITLAEIAAARAARFAAADTNGDGLLSPEELAAHAEARRADRMGERQARMIERLDSDGDGLLSLDELPGDDEARGPARLFERFDENADGALTREEMADARMDGKGGHGMRGEHGLRDGHGKRGQHGDGGRRAPWWLRGE